MDGKSKAAPGCEGYVQKLSISQDQPGSARISQRLHAPLSRMPPLRQFVLESRVCRWGATGWCWALPSVLLGAEPAAISHQSIQHVSDAWGEIELKESMPYHLASVESHSSVAHC